MGDIGLVLTIIGKETFHVIPYSIQSKTNNNYAFRCTHENDATSTILYSTIKNNDKTVTLNMTENYYINYIRRGGADTRKNRGIAIFRKTSSGLITGIVIVYVIYIIASIISIMMWKSAFPPIQPQSPNVIGLSSFDNYF